MHHCDASRDPATTASASGRLSIPAAILWSTAILLTALILLQAGRLPESTAHAAMGTTDRHGFSLVTANAGTGGDAQPNELFYVLDSRGEMLFIYQMEDVKDRRLNLLGGASLPTLFRAGRGR